MVSISGVREYYQRYSILFGIGLVLITIAAILDPEIRSFLNSNSGSLSAILTLSLVLLYFAQFRTQKRQQNLMEISNEPHLLVEGYRGELDGGRTHQLELDISNLGDAIAHDLKLELQTEIFHPQFIGRDETRILKQKTDEDYMWFSKQRNYLEPKEFHTIFLATIGLKWKYLPENAITKTAIYGFQDYADEHDIDKFRLTATLIYSSRSTGEQREPVFDMMVPANVRSVNDILHYGMDFEDYQKRADTPGDPFDKFSYQSSPVGLARYGSSHEDTDPEQFPTTDELREKLLDLGKEKVHVRVSSGVVVPAYITNIESDPDSKDVTIEGRKEIDEKNDVKIEMDGDDYKIYENKDYVDGWTELNRVTDIIRKVESHR